MRLRIGVLVGVACAALALPGCASPLSAPPSSASATGTSATGTSATGEPTIEVDYAALEKSIEESISSGPVELDNVRAVLVVVDGQTKIAHYRHGFTAEDHEHVWSVTKSIVSTLIGISVADGLISSLDAPLSELLPEHRDQMKPEVARVTLRQLLTMSAGFGADLPDETLNAIVAGRRDLVDAALSEGQQTRPGLEFDYSNTGAHLVAAVLLDALRRNAATREQTVLDYARVKLFDPLGIVTRPVHEGIPLTKNSAFDRAGFAWMRVGDLHLGGFGIRLTAEDMVKLGQLYLDDGMWQGHRLLPERWGRQATAPSPLSSYYGMFWWRDTQWGHQLFAARGARGQRIVVVPDRRAVIVTLSFTATDTPIGDSAIEPLINDKILMAMR